MQERKTPVGKRTARRRETIEESEGPFTNSVGERNPRSVWAYRCCVGGLVPGLGLLLGPAAVVLALLARRQAGKQADTKARSLANASLLIGALLTVTTWLGLTLMIVGLRSP